MRRTAPSSAEMEAQIDRLLAVGVGENPRESLSELAKLGARLIIQRAVEDEFDAWLGGFARTIPVYFHVISAGPSAAEGNIKKSQIDSQIRVFNRAFSGGYGGVGTPFSFVLAGVTRTQNAEWFSMGYQSQPERRAKSALRQGGADALNIHSTDGAGHVLLGWATFPSHYAGQPLIDGIVVHFGSLPGGFIDDFSKGPDGHARGRTLVRAVSHVPERLLEPG